MKNTLRTKASKRFYYIKKLIEEKEDMENVEGWYFSGKAVRYLEKLNTKFFANGYYDMTIAQILLEVRDNKNLKEVEKELHNDYQPYYAKAWFENMVTVLGR